MASGLAWLDGAWQPRNGRRGMRQDFGVKAAGCLTVILASVRRCFGLAAVYREGRYKEAQKIRGDAPALRHEALGEGHRYALE